MLNVADADCITGDGDMVVVPCKARCSNSICDDAIKFVYLRLKFVLSFCRSLLNFLSTFTFTLYLWNWKWITFNAKYFPSQNKICCTPTCVKGFRKIY